MSRRKEDVILRPTIGHFTLFNISRGKKTSSFPILRLSRLEWWDQVWWGFRLSFITLVVLFGWILSTLIPP
jgi:hypothetical protein